MVGGNGSPGVPKSPGRRKRGNTSPWNTINYALPIKKCQHVIGNLVVADIRNPLSKSQ